MNFWRVRSWDLPTIPLSSIQLKTHLKYHKSPEFDMKTEYETSIKLNTKLVQIRISEACADKAFHQSSARRCRVRRSTAASPPALPPLPPPGTVAPLGRQDELKSAIPADRRDLCQAVLPDLWRRERWAGETGQLLSREEFLICIYFPWLFSN